MNTNKKKRYYIIGIGGVAMASIAGLLKQKGHEVAGSDHSEMYEPMKGMLKKQKIPVFTAFKPKNVKKYKPDVVIVGNAISRGNPELEFTLSNGLIYRSVSDILRDEFIEGKKSIVIAGTHGKTTTSALVGWILECAGMDPTIFVGGFMRNINSNFKFGQGKYVVLEGDEYDTCFFDKNPKIFAYRPFIGLINNIELDHIDIYANYEAVRNAFLRFSRLVPQNGLVLLNAENNGCVSINPLIKGNEKLWGVTKLPKILTFGIKKGNYTVRMKHDRETNSLIFDIIYKGRYVSDICSDMSGQHNIQNILAAFAIARFIKIPEPTIRKAIASFKGVKRRAEIILEREGITVIDDYAHHPTAVAATILGLRERFHGKRIVVLFEPGSASSKRRIFEKEYFKALQNADVVYLYRPFHVEQMNSKEIFNGKGIARKLSRAGTPAWSIHDLDKLLFHVKQHLQQNDVIVIMSCRGFDGLRERIIQEL